MGKDLEARRSQLKEVKDSHRDEEARLTKVHAEQLEEMWRRQEVELLEVEEEAEDMTEHLRKEIELLENEMGQMPDELVSALEDQARLEVSRKTTSSQLSELELELQCCSCQKVCRPPASIYQVAASIVNSSLNSCSLEPDANSILSHPKKLRQYLGRYFQTMTRFF